MDSESPTITLRVPGNGSMPSLSMNCWRAHSSPVKCLPWPIPVLSWPCRCCLTAASVRCAHRLAGWGDCYESRAFSLRRSGCAKVGLSPCRLANALLPSPEASSASHHTDSICVALPTEGNIRRCRSSGRGRPFLGWPLGITIVLVCGFCSVVMSGSLFALAVGGLPLFANASGSLCLICANA